MYHTGNYTFLDFPMLPSLQGSRIPFHTQAQPVPDPLQVHTTLQAEHVVSSAYNQANTLPYGHFMGTYHKQVNQPKFLGANERIVFQSSW